MKNGKRRGPGRPFKKNDPLTGEKDERINRNGAPPREASYAATLRLLGGLDGPAIVEWAGEQAKEFRKLPPDVNLMTMACLWAFASLSRDFSPGVFNSIVDRVDGPLSEALEARLAAIERYITEAQNERNQTD
jgi:hypothetical protein